MPKQLLLLALLSVIIVLFASEVKVLLHYYDGITTFVELQLTHLFQPTELGSLLRKTITLLLTAIVIAGIPAIVYWTVKNKQLPYIYHVIWIIWLITVTKLSIS